MSALSVKTVWRMLKNGYRIYYFHYSDLRSYSIFNGQNEFFCTKSRFIQFSFEFIQFNFRLKWRNIFRKNVDL